MIIDTEDPATLSHLNPLERQMLRNVTDRLAMVAWQRVGWMGEPTPAPALTERQPTTRAGGRR